MATRNRKLWGGRFQKKTPFIVNQFNASLSFDKVLYPYDIQGSMAHVKMLGRRKIIKKTESQKILRGLKKIQEKIDSGKFKWNIQNEDVHLNIENELIKLVGEVGGKLHTARSRNDQVATDLRLYARDQVKKILALLRAFQKNLVILAKKNVNVILPGYTHLQRAQPISLAHHILAYFEMTQRDVARLKESLARIDTLPLGSGALAGTTFPIDRAYVARELKFQTITANSLDAVGDRDFVIEILSNLALLMMHLSRLAEEWILWATQEFQFIRLPEEFCTGSSMMPQKMNPDTLELVRGKTGRVYGALLSLLTTMKGLPLAYNKDMQEDKEPLFDAVETVKACLTILTLLTEKVGFNSRRMQQALNEGFVLSTDLADYLVTREIPFRQAHETVGNLVAYCQAHHLDLKHLSLKQLKKFHPKFSADVYEWLNEVHAVDRRTSLGGTARKNIRTQIQKAESILKKSKN